MEHRFIQWFSLIYSWASSLKFSLNVLRLHFGISLTYDLATATSTNSRSSWPSVESPTVASSVTSLLRSSYHRVGLRAVAPAAGPTIRPPGLPFGFLDAVVRRAWQLLPCSSESIRGPTNLSVIAGSWRKPHHCSDQAQRVTSTGYSMGSLRDHHGTFAKDEATLETSRRFELQVEKEHDSRNRTDFYPSSNFSKILFHALLFTSSSYVILRNVIQSGRVVPIDVWWTGSVAFGSTKLWRYGEWQRCEVIDRRMASGKAVVEYNSICFYADFRDKLK